MIKRYVVHGKGSLEAQANGNFMKYADHAALITKVREIAEKLQTVNEPGSYEHGLATELLELCARGGEHG